MELNKSIENELKDMLMNEDNMLKRHEQSMRRLVVKALDNRTHISSELLRNVFSWLYNIGNILGNYAALCCRKELIQDFTDLPDEKSYYVNDLLTRYKKTANVVYCIVYNIIIIIYSLSK